MAARKPRAAAPAVGIVLDPVSDTAPAVNAQPFTRVYSSSIKGGFDVNLGLCTAIVGENRAGKTAVLDAMRLALTGQHPVGPHYADLLALTGGLTPNAHLTGPDAEAHATVQAGRKSLDLAHSGALAGLTTAQRAALLPLSSVRDLLALGSDRAREAIFARFGSATTMPVPPGLDDDQTQLWVSLSADAEGADAATKLASMGSLLRSHKLACGRQAKGADEEAENWRSTAPAVPATAEQVADLEAAYAKAVAFEQSEATRAALEAACIQLEGIETSEIMVGPPPVDLSPVAGFDTAIKELDNQIEALQRRLGAARVITKMRERLADGSAHTCVTCTQAVSAQVIQSFASTPSLEAAVMAELQRLGGQKGEVENRKSQLSALAARTTAERAQVDAHNRAHERRCDALRAQIASLESSLADVSDPGSTSAAISAALTTARNGRAASAKINDALLRARKAKREADDCKVLEKAAAGILSQLVAGVAAKAEEAVRKYLPDSAFGVRLALEDAEGKAACRWEVRGSDGTYHPFGAASGAEWGALTVALGCAWSEGAPVRILMLDDADLAPLSPTNVFALLNMVQTRVEAGDLTQAVVAWCRPEEVPEGWTIVKRSR